MEKPRIRPWNENTKDTEEKFMIAVSTRIALPGQPAKVFKKGSEISVSGGTKKDLYFRNLIFYPDDFEKVMAYQKQQHEQYREKPEVTIESAASAAKSGVNKGK